MKIAISCGGTGGHVFPGLAVAEQLNERGHEVVLWLGGKSIEGATVEGWTGRTVVIRSEGISGAGMRLPRAVWRLVRAITRSRFELRRDSPDVMLAMGGYASVGPALGARLAGVPLMLHEANFVPGRAIEFLSRFAVATAVSFDDTRILLRKAIVTGFPVRKDIGHMQPRAYGPKELRTVLIMGGSQGSSSLNWMAAEALCILHRKDKSVRVIHLTGAKDEKAVRERYTGAGVTHEVHAFRRDMATVYSKVDFAVCRSGAATCAELSLAALPALLVPYPAAVRNHQFENANALVRRQQADVIAESLLTPDRLAEYLEKTLKNDEGLRTMSAAAASRTAGSPAAAIADLLETVGRR